MKKTILALVLFFSCLINIVKAQTDKSVQVLPKQVNESEAKPGTYQIIYHPSKIQYAFTNDILKEIEKNRDEKEIKYIWLTPTVQVKILPKEYIQSSKFIPLVEVMHVDE